MLTLKTAALAVLLVTGNGQERELTFKEKLKAATYKYKEDELNINLSCDEIFKNVQLDQNCNHLKNQFSNDYNLLNKYRSTQTVDGLSSYDKEEIEKHLQASSEYNKLQCSDFFERNPQGTLCGSHRYGSFATLEDKFGSIDEQLNSAERFERDFCPERIIRSKQLKECLEQNK